MSDTQTQQSPYETRTSWDLFVNGAPAAAQSGYGKLNCRNIGWIARGAGLSRPTRATV